MNCLNPKKGTTMETAGRVLDPSTHTAPTLGCAASEGHRGADELAGVQQGPWPEKF